MSNEFQTANRLINLLPANQRQDFLARLERVHLPHGMMIAHAGKPLDYVYFPSSGIGSVMAVTQASFRSEAGMFGREGFAPTASSVGADTNPYDIMIQVAGYGHRLAIPEFREVVLSSQEFSNVLSRFIFVFAAQVSYTALANAAFKVDQRLARWILMCHDRADSTEIPITHDFISLLLAVRRPSVTTALHVLEGERLIRSERGRVVIRDRRGLEKYAADSYGRPETEYRLLIDALSAS